MQSPSNKESFASFQEDVTDVISRCMKTVCREN